MKYALFIATFLISLSAMQAQGDGIQFVKGKEWAEILAQAKSEDKLIFMDAYTTWCGPCKKMSKEIFPLKEVGDFYNAHFVNVKMDMEKGEGPGLAQAYSVRAYPTLLFINGDGEAVHRMAGYMDASQFLTLGEEANTPLKTLSGMQKSYAQGNRDPEFLQEYTEASYNAADNSHSKIAEAYLETQSDWESTRNMEFILQYVDRADSKGFEHIIQNRELYEQNFGKPIVAQKIQTLVYNEIYYADPSPSLEEIKGIFHKYFPENSGLLYANFKMSYYRQLGNREGYAQAAVERFKEFPANDYGELNEAAWTFYQVIEDKELLETALGWARKSVKMQKRYENLDTVAHLYHKLGKNRQAKCQAKKAIKLGKASHEDVALTEELLKKIAQGE